MTLSIITPCFNGAEFIETAILSILRQDTEEAELIIVNDGSFDETESICQPYVSSASSCPRHPAIRYYRTENKGAGHARNFGIERAAGEWIAFLDADDLYLDHALNEHFFARLSDYHAESVDVIQTVKLKTDMTLSEKIDILMPEKKEDIKHHIPMLEFWTCIYRRDFLKAHNIHFYEYRKQDVETAFRYLAYVHADKIRTDTTINFYLQRNNLKSNTHTWNTYHLHQIKSSIYYDLFKQTPCKEDRPFLYNVVVEQLVAYYELCQKHGYDSKDGYKWMHALLTEVKKLHSLPLNPELALRFKKICRWDLKARLFGVKTTPNSGIALHKADVTNPLQPKEMLFQRLTELSPALLHLQ